MSLKLRNILACVLILFSAVCWSSGKMFQDLYIRSGGTDVAVTSPAETLIHETIVGSEGVIVETTEPEVLPTEPGNLLDFYFPNMSLQAAKANGIILGCLALAMAVCAVFLLWQSKPFLGPDGVILALAILSTNRYSNRLNYGIREDLLIYILNTALFFACLRELWGWLRDRFSGSWYLLPRLAGRLPGPPVLLFGVWSMAVSWMTCFQFLRGQLRTSGFLLIAAGMALFCLWKYGRELQHFETQLEHFQLGQPIEVTEGMMKKAEGQLLRVQNQHKEAVEKAVASERFKVDLISNVSHDLRTPLTAIVGYGELLKGEMLSEEGTMQLNRLNQKAGYMRELVDSLFELTKVSSGILPCKMEKIDLIRLLEQTIGLMDDQLSQAGLTVKRHYPENSVPLVTDGSRMHQVFANLLGNAIKYAMPGTRIHLEASETDSAIAVRWVNTSSYPMDFTPDEILERFARGDKARSTGGSGLGLAIAKTYTESVGGTFRVSIDSDQFSAIVILPKNDRNL